MFLKTTTHFRQYGLAVICMGLAACQSTPGDKKNASLEADQKLAGLWEQHSSQVSYVIWRKPDGTFVEKSIRKWELDPNQKPVIRTDSGRWSIEISKKEIPFKKREDGSFGLQVIEMGENQFLHYSSDDCVKNEQRVKGDPAKAFENTQLYLNESNWDTPICNAPETAKIWYVMNYNH